MLVDNKEEKKSAMYVSQHSLFFQFREDGGGKGEEKARLPLPLLPQEVHLDAGMGRSSGLFTFVIICLSLFIFAYPCLNRIRATETSSPSTVPSRGAPSASPTSRVSCSTWSSTAPSSGRTARSGTRNRSRTIRPHWWCRRQRKPKKIRRKDK